MATLTQPPTAPVASSRRSLLRSATTLRAIAGLGTSHVARGAGAGRVLKMGDVVVRDSHYGAGAVEFARAVEAATGGA